MLLLSLMVWTGPGRYSPISDEITMERPEARVSRLPLAQALEALKRYEQAFNRDGRGLSISHRLLGVQVIDDEIGEEILARYDVYNIEDAAHRLELENSEEAGA